MSVGNIQVCSNTLADVMLENRLQIESASTNIKTNSLNSTQFPLKGVEPASIDANNNEPSSLDSEKISPFNAVTATEPISKSTIDMTLENNKNIASTYQGKVQQRPDNYALGLLVDLKA